MTQQNYTIIVIEDDPLISKTVKDGLSLKYSRVITFTDPGIALNEIPHSAPDLILLDNFLGHQNGLDILEQIRKQGILVPVLMITSPSDIKMAIRAIKLGAEDFVVKPLDIEQLDISVEKALHNFELKIKVDLLSEKLREEMPNDIIGESDGIQKAISIGKILAGADTTVLLLGESGTGKELMAKYLHDNSQRAKGPFITINCGAIPRELAENELFGYERGAFTGATEKIKFGKFEMAHHGSILFDEIAELSLELQVKLLRVLQERKFYRLGGSKEISVDVRVIASTNKDLETLVEQGKFREDLFYRLNVAKITLPPLRDRDSDIMLLASAFVGEFNKKFNKNVSRFTPEAVSLLESYNWKGNIRELRNVIERVVLLEANDEVTKESLHFLKSSNFVSPSLEKLLPELKKGEHFLMIENGGVALGDVVKDLLLQTLKLTNWNQNKASKILGISRSKLRYRMEQLDISYTAKSNTE